MPREGNVPTVTDGYQDGDMFENYIDIPGGNYRVYFFGEDNVLLDKFDPIGFNAVTGTDYSKYEIYGRTPQSVRSLSKFKVMVLANWPVYPAVEAGKTTIDNILDSDFAKYDCLTNQELSIDEGRLIPMYGIREYTGITFTAGERTDLDSPVTMLRAMAKVEVILDVDQDIEFADVTLNGYNERGYCAPQRVYSQNDYGQGYDWEHDYLHRLHLVGGVNDDGADSRQLPLRRVNKKTADKKETWVAYIPEYRNVKVNADGTADAAGAAAADEAYIDLRLDFQTPDEKPFRIYFAEYPADGTVADAAALKRNDIERNNIYRFTVNYGNGSLIIKAKKWENTYDNKFVYE